MTTLAEALEALIAATSRGLALRDIQVALSARGLERVPDRTLRRRLTALVAAGRVRKEGTSRDVRYFPAQTEQSGAQDAGIALSTDGQAILETVRKPLSARRLTGYDASLLRDYVPGRTWYLDEQRRAHLHRAGRVLKSSDPAGTFARQVYERLLIDLAWSSSRLEGNTYSRLDTENLLERGQVASGKDTREAQMILNHKKAIELLVEGAQEIAFNRYTVCNLHAALSENLLSDRQDEGRVRQREVGITGTTYLPLGIPQQLNELLDQLLVTAEAIPDPFEQAFFAMVHLPYLQPFIDVNKRTSRLAANIPLIRHNLCPLSFIDVPEQLYVEATLGVYELRRTTLLADLFVWAYERSAARYRIVRDSVPQPDPIRLRYRNALSLFVQEIVRSPARASTDCSADLLNSLGVAPEDHEAFAVLAKATIADLHDGVIARYGLRPGEFDAWKNARAPMR